MTLITGDDGLAVVDLRFDSLRNLQEDLGPYLALDGFFLRGETSVSTSDVIRFRMMLPGDFVLVEGAGVIVWVRTAEEAGPLDPVGAAVGFATLSEQGRELVERIVQTHIENGGKQFDLSRPAVTAAPVDGGEETHVLKPSQTPAESDSAYRFTVRGKEDEAAANSVVNPSEPVAEEPAVEGLSGAPLELDLPFDEGSAIERPAPEIHAPETALPEAPAAEMAAPEIVDTELPVPEMPTTDLSTPETPTFEGPIEEEDRPGSSPEGEPEAQWAPSVAPEESSVAMDEVPNAERVEASVAVAVDDLTGVDEAGSDSTAQRASALQAPTKLDRPGAEPDPDRAWVGPNSLDIVTAPPSSDIEDSEPAAPMSDFDIQFPNDSDTNPGISTPRSSSGKKGFDDLFSINGELRPEPPKKKRRRGLWAAVIIVAVTVGAWYAWMNFPQATAFLPFLQGEGSLVELQPSEQTPTPDAALVLSEEEVEAAVAAAVEAIETEPSNQESGGGETETATPETQAGDAIPPKALLEPPPEPLAAATVLSEVRWETVDGGTEVVIRGNGSFARARIRDDGLSSPPRILIRLRDIRATYRPLEVPVGSAEIDRIRFGHHPETTPQSMWVVFDLLDPAARVQAIETGGDTIRIRVGAGGG